MSTAITPANAASLLSEEIAKTAPEHKAKVRRIVASSVGENPILMADMYKATHAGQLPDKTETITSFFEARAGAKLHNIVNFGLQIILDDIAAICITQEHVNEAKTFFAQTFADSNIFNEKGWQLIVDEHKGSLPVRILALPEGMVVPPGTPLFTIENTDPRIPWIGNWLETMMMHLWYPVTVASYAFHQRNTLEKHLLKEGVTIEEAQSTAKMSFVDFGMRGVTSLTSAARAGAAVLTSFTASDNTLGGKLLGTAYGGCDDYSKIFTSIPAAEHMTITIHGSGNEKDAYLNMLCVYPTGCVSIVSDSYDYKKAVSILWCGELVETVKFRHAKAKQQAPDQPHFVVIRPDSGDMIDNVLYTLDQLASAYGFTTNDKGFKLLSDEVRVIQGDGINLESYGSLLEALHASNWSVKNLVAGSGGGLLQKMDRDTLRCAIKASVATVDGTERGIRKDTVGKASKRGRLSVEMEEDRIVVIEDGKGDEKRNMLDAVYENGKRLKTETYSEVRSRIDAEHQKIHASRASSQAHKAS